MKSIKKVIELQKKKLAIKKQINRLEDEMLSIEQEILELQQNLEFSENLEKNKRFKTSKSFEIEVKNLNTSWRHHGIIHFPVELRNKFPNYKVNFELQTNIGAIRKTHVSGANYEAQRRDRATAGTYLCGGLKPWFQEHQELRDGDKILFTIIEPHRKYKLDIIK